MMWSAVRSHWRVLGPQMTTRWPCLTPTDIEQASGQRSKLIALVGSHYELDETDAAEQVDAFVRSLQVLSL